MFQAQKLSYRVVLKSLSNLKKHKKFIRKCMKKKRKKMEINIVELGTYSLLLRSEQAIGHF
jgi:uncharacterized protein YlxP (DUF503 family)